MSHDTFDNPINYHNQKEVIDATIDDYTTKRGNLEAQLAATQDPDEQEALSNHIASFDQTWEELGGFALETAQRAVDELEDDEDEDDYASITSYDLKNAYKALRDAEDDFYNNIVAKLEQVDTPVAEDIPVIDNPVEDEISLPDDAYDAIEPLNTFNQPLEDEAESEQSYESAQEEAIRLLDEFSDALEQEITDQERDTPRPSAERTAAIGSSAVSRFNLGKSNSAVRERLDRNESAKKAKTTRQAAKNTWKQRVNGVQETQRSTSIEPKRVGRIMSMFYTYEPLTKEQIQKKGRKAMKKMKRK